MNEFKYVVDNSEYVKIDFDKVDNFIENLGELNYQHWSKELGLGLTEDKMILLAFILESMNFCFWQKPKWEIEYKDETYGGSNALFYSIIYEVENNKDFLNIEYLKKIDINEFKKIFISVNGEISLIDERFRSFKNVVDKVADENFFQELYSIKTDKDLLKYIVENFETFDDKSLYKNMVIHFNKRATLLVNDLFYMSDTIKNNIKHVNNLSGCADYGIPRTFRDYDILIYSEELAVLVDAEQEILHDSEMEIEIRANMLYVIEIIKENLSEKGKTINSVELDNLIWLMGKKNDKKSNTHHTVTIYY